MVYHSEEHMVSEASTYGKPVVKVRKGQNLGPCYEFEGIPLVCRYGHDISIVLKGSEQAFNMWHLGQFPDKM